jgi:hypothetical protein
MKPLLKIRILAVVLIVFFSLGTLGATLAFFLGFLKMPVLEVAVAIATNVGFVVAGIGLLLVKRWAWWLTLILCGVSILHLIWSVFTTLTPETATKASEIGSYLAVGIYLGIGFLLTSESVRKVFKEPAAPPA